VTRHPLVGVIKQTSELFLFKILRPRLYPFISLAQNTHNNQSSHSPLRHRNKEGNLLCPSFDDIGLYFVALQFMVRHRKVIVTLPTLCIKTTSAICLTYLLTPWSRVLLEKLTGSQLVKKFRAFYGTQMFISVLTSARHLSLS
jgi:hypothetical protein